MRERLAVEQLKDMPRNMVMISGPSLYEPSADKKLAALELYDKLLPHLLPNDSALNTSHLWHNDLHHENIFVDPSNPTEITAILDWQSSYIAPLFDHSLVPSVLSSGYGGGVPVGDDLSEPKIPPDYNTLSAHKKRVVMQDIEAQSLLVAWHRLLKVKNPSQYAALRFQDTTIGSLNSIIRRIAEAGEAHFLALLLKLRDEWMVSQHDLPSSSSFPPQSLLDNLISKDVEDRIRQDASDADVGIELMGRLAVLMGDLWPDKGLVTHDDYQKTKDALAQKLEELIRDFATNEDQREAFRRYWPFDD